MIVVPLTLVSAVYEIADTITLSFDRAIDISAFNPSAVLVDDGEFEDTLFEATIEATLLTPQTVQIGLNPIDVGTGATVRLTATSASGIVAVDDGAAWAGVTALELPFP